MAYGLIEKEETPHNNFLFFIFKKKGVACSYKSCACQAMVLTWEISQ
jgi:hypothetical protein